MMGTAVSCSPVRSGSKDLLVGLVGPEGLNLGVTVLPRWPRQGENEKIPKH